MPKKAYCQIVLAFGTLASISLVFNMAAMKIYWEQLFVTHYGAVDSIGVLILIGFLSILVFNIASILYEIHRIAVQRNAKRLDVIMLVLGSICVLFMLGEKAMIDEIGREIPLGWETTGEWMILYGFLTLQFVYNVLILGRLYRNFRGESMIVLSAFLESAP